MVRITEASEADLSIIHELAHIIWPKAYQDILSPQQLSYMLESMYSIDALTSLYNEEGNQFLLASENERAIAFALYHPKENEASVYRLSKIYVHPSSKGKGVGKMLVSHIINDITHKGALFLELNVNRNNPAVEFYKHLGFTVSGTEDIDIGNGYFMNDYVMRLRIGSSVSQ